MWEGFNLEYGNLKNGDLEGIFVSKIVDTGILKTFDCFLKNNLKNAFIYALNWAQI
jgi:hypothetical protein